MKNVIVLLTVFILVTIPCFAQTITSDEKEYGKLYLLYYSGQIPNFPADSMKSETFIWHSDEAAKQTILKAFIKDVILPREQVSRNSLQNALTQIDNTIAVLQDYVK